jgi:hypothetical protein
MAVWVVRYKQQVEGVKFVVKESLLVLPVCLRKVLVGNCLGCWRAKELEISVVEPVIVEYK